MYRSPSRQNALGLGGHRSQLEKGFESKRSKFKTDHRSKSFKLGYPSFYQNQNYHIIHEKGINNEHEMSI